MDKAIIVGVYEFIGFHFCLSLLEKGIEVQGIHLPSDEKDIFFDDKRLSIGRNSNFSEKDPSCLQSLCIEQKNTILFIDFYSYFMNKQESKLMMIIDQLKPSVKLQTVIIMPIQLREEKDNTNNYPFLSEVFKDSWNFYLPAVYGPWQPPNFLFHQAMMASSEKMKVNEREYTVDALYIEDIVGIILDELQHKKEQNIFLLKSKINNSWEKIRKMLTENVAPEFSRDVVPNGSDKYSLYVESTSLEKGIENQRNHLIQLQLIER